MYILDDTNGKVRKYGADKHDSLKISHDGRTLSYENLQNGDGSKYGDYRFCTDESGKLPCEDFELIRHGADAYFNIGGFGNERSTTKEIIKALEEAKNAIENDSEKYAETWQLLKDNDVYNKLFHIGVQRALITIMNEIIKWDKKL